MSVTVPKHLPGDELYASYDDEFAHRSRIDEIVRERIRSLRSGKVRRNETILLRAARDFGIHVFFDQDKYRCNGMYGASGITAPFSFVSPVPLSWSKHETYPSINVLDGTIHWPAPLLSSDPFVFIHEIAHLLVGSQPPGLSDEDGIMATFELGLVRHLREVCLSGNATLVMTDDAWWDWRVDSGNDPVDVRRRAEATQTLLVGKWFNVDGTQIRHESFTCDPAVKQLANSIRQWYLHGHTE